MKLTTQSLQIGPTGSQGIAGPTGPSGPPGTSLLHLLGPFSVDFAAPNLTNGATAGIHLADLAAGTLVVLAWAFIDIAFNDGTGAGSLSLVVGDPAGDWDSMIVYNAGQAPYPTSAGVALEAGLDANTVTAPRRVMRANVAGSLRAWVQAPGALIAGHATVYALIIPPA